MSNPPRPDTWEIPDLRNQTSFFLKPISLRNDISARLLDILTNIDFADDQANNRHIETFLRTAVRFGRHEDWNAHRLLGKGGYGLVGLWVRRDATNAIIDELAVKEQSTALGQQDEFSEYEEPGWQGMHGVLAEAVIQKQLNEFACENILHLRGYSYVTASKPQPSQSDAIEDRWGTRPNDDGGQNADQSDADDDFYGPDEEDETYRMYTEFSPYQTLSELRDRYRNWHQFLPEPFLWHLFDSLAAAAQVLEKGPQTKFSSTGLTRLGARRWPRDWGVIHFDIKPGNIFLGYETLKDETASVTGGSRILGYPVIKLSDYGLAKITGPGDADNPRRYFWRGTRHYRPSEQDQYGAEWRAPPNGKARPDKTIWGTPFPVDQLQAQEKTDPNPGWCFGSAANVWNIGKVMYDMTTLSRSAVLDRRIIIDNNTQERYLSNGHHFINQSAWNRTPFDMACEADHKPEVPYSAALMELVRECLRPAIKRRITPDALRYATQAGLARAEHDLDPANAGRPAPDTPATSSNSRRAQSTTLNVPRLYCRGTEINDMPAGTTQFTRIPKDDYLRMMKKTWQDPEWPDLIPPREIWDDMMDMYGPAESPLPHNYTVVNGRIHFRSRDSDDDESGGVRMDVDDDGHDPDDMVYDVDDIASDRQTQPRRNTGVVAAQRDDDDLTSLQDVPL